MERMTMSAFLNQIKQNVKNGSFEKIQPLAVSTPDLSQEQYRRRQDQLRAMELAIDSNYAAIKTREVSKYQVDNPDFLNYFKFSKEIAREILRFDPDERKVGLYIHGPAGMGKTAISKTLAIRLNERFRGQVKFMRMIDVIDAMTADDFSFKEEIKRRLVYCRFLFLDDLGTERDTAWVKTQVYDILDKRLHAETWEGQRLFTFLTSNYSVEQLSQRYDDRDFRRITEISEAIAIR